MRMSQLSSSRAIIFMIGIVCLIFGASSLVLERQQLEHRELAEIELTKSTTVGTATMPSIAAISHDEQVLYAAIAGYGLLCLLLAKFLYHAPMTVPILAMIGFAGAYVVFWKFNHSESPTLYTISCLCILGALILTIRAGHQFHLSYARMGRPNER